MNLFLAAHQILRKRIKTESCWALLSEYFLVLFVVQIGEVNVMVLHLNQNVAGSNTTGGWLGLATDSFE